jgi:hypothetical protein
MGITGKKVTFAWLKEFLGNVFIQSFHALAYGFILANCTGLRGIEALCVYASIIPLTSVIRQVTGLGGGELLKKGSQLTTAVGSTIGAGVQAGASIKASKTLADAQEEAANITTKGSKTGSAISVAGTALGTAVGAVAGTVVPGAGNVAGASAGAAIGGLVGSAVGSIFGGTKSASASIKAAGVIADATTEAGKITAAGGMFNAGMGLAMNTVLDSGDGGATQAGVRGVEHGEEMKQQARGRYAEQKAQTVSRTAENIANSVNSAITRGAMVAGRSMGSFAKTGTAGTVAGATGLAAGAAGGAAAGLTEGSFQSFNAPGYTNGVSNRFASNSLSSYGTIKTGSVTRSDDGKTYNYQDFAVNRAKMNEIKRQMPDAVKGSTGSDGVFDASSGTFAELARVENN